MLKECVHREQELEQEYKKSMDENISFSEQEWEEYQLKAKDYRHLKKYGKRVCSICIDTECCETQGAI